MRKTLALLALLAAAPLPALEPAPAPAPATPASTPAGGGDFSEENLQFDFALGLLRRNLFAEAQTEFGKFLAAFPASARKADAWRYRGEAAYGRHDYAAAANDYYQYLRTNPPLDLGLRQRYAICLYELKRPADALAILRPLLPLAEREENRAHRPALHYYLALAARDGGDDAAAARDFQAVADVPGPTPFTPLALYALGEIQQAQGQHGLAARYFERLVKEYPAHELAPAARLAQSNALRQGGLPDQSVAAFRELANSPDPAIRARARYGLAGALAESGQPEEAAAQARETLKDPAAKEFHDGAHYLLATLLFGQKRYPEAIAEAEAVAPGGEFGENAAVTRAWALYRKGDFAAARQAAEEGAARRPQNEDFPYLAGRACWELGQYPEAAAHFTAARDRATKHDGKRAESAALEAAMAWEKAGRPAEAVALYEWLRQTYPDGASGADARFGLGRALMAAGRHEAALPVWEGISQDPRVAPERRESALFQQAAAYYYLKQYSNLRAACERLLKEFPAGPNAPDALYWLAWRDMEDKDYEKALARYREFVQRHPAHRLAPKARYYAGAALLKMNREDEAAAAFYDIVRAGETLEGRELLWLASRLGERQDAAKAEEIFAALLKDEKEPMLRAVGLLGRAKLRRAAANWEGAAADSEAALKLLPQLSASATVATALENEANFGLAVARRERGLTALAAEALAKVKVSPDDPFTARLHFERGLLALAQGQYAEAGELLLRVGLLTADPAMAGEALWRAAEACERNHDSKRARICYDELAGAAPGSFGALNPDSPWRQRALEALKKLAPAAAQP